MKVVLVFLRHVLSLANVTVTFSKDQRRTDVPAKLGPRRRIRGDSGPESCVLTQEGQVDELADTINRSNTFCHINQARALTKHHGEAMITELWWAIVEGSKQHILISVLFGCDFVIVNGRKPEFGSFRLEAIVNILRDVSVIKET